VRRVRQVLCRGLRLNSTTPGATGPCMTCVNVIDIVADFVADPFIIKLQQNEKKVPWPPSLYLFIK
jgi:hypothetical protein